MSTDGQTSPSFDNNNSIDGFECVAWFLLSVLYQLFYSIYSVLVMLCFVDVLQALLEVERWKDR